MNRILSSSSHCIRRRIFNSIIAPAAVSLLLATVSIADGEKRMNTQESLEDRALRIIDDHPTLFSISEKIRHLPWLEYMYASLPSKKHFEQAKANNPDSNYDEIILIAQKMVHEEVPATKENFCKFYLDEFLRMERDRRNKAGIDDRNLFYSIITTLEMRSIREEISIDEAKYIYFLDVYINMCIEKGVDPVSTYTPPFIVSDLYALIYDDLSKEYESND